jgi:hypothetical protein
MTSKLWKVLAVSLGVVVCLVVLQAVIPGGGWGEDGETGAGIAERVRGAIQLTRPVFASGGGLAGADFLQEEAGISAFTSVRGGIDLGRARGAFRTIERVTDEYIIGYVSLPGKGEWWDAHVFVHHDGWIIAYYHRDRSTGTIINWANPAVTNLETALRQVAAAAGVSLGDVGLYDFRFPTAQRLLVIVDRDEFRMNIPKEFIVHDHSFSLEVITHKIGGWGSFSISGAEITSIRPPRDAAVGISRTVVGAITPAALKPGVLHTITISTEDARARAAIILTYSEN